MDEREYNERMANLLRALREEEAELDRARASQQFWLMVWFGCFVLTVLLSLIGTN